MQLKKSFPLSSITAVLLLSSTLVQSENYVSIEYLQYDESDDRISVSAPSIEVSYDFDTDYNLKASMMFDGISGATPSFLENTNGNFYKGLQKFDDTRTAGSILLTSRFENRDELYTGFDYSKEEDYESFTPSMEYMHYTDKTHNTAINFGVSVGFNEILVYDAASGASDNSHTEKSMSYNAQIGLTQVLTSESSMKLSLFMVSDDGYLTNPHGIIVRDYNTNKTKLGNENRPDTRNAYGFTGNYNRLLTDKVSLLSSYRFYKDDWDMTSHTIEVDTYMELSDDVTLGLGVRYYTQLEANFYNANIDYFTTQKYASSDERLSKFDAFTYKASIDYKQNDTLSYNVGIQVYEQNTISNMSATAITVGVKYKF
jgi:hypothetical protein